MSYVTTVLFATSWPHVAERFEAIVSAGYTRYGTPYEIKPTEQDGPKCGPGTVYYHGFNYIDWDLLESLRNEPWPLDTILWIYGEDAEPGIQVGQQVVLEAEPIR